MKSRSDLYYALFPISLALIMSIAACPRPPEMPAEDAKVAVVLSTALLGKGLDEGVVPAECIAAIAVSVDDIVIERVTPSGTQFVSVLPDPFVTDLLGLQGLGAVLASVEIPAGDYVGGELVLRNAVATIQDKDTLEFFHEPVVLPSGGRLAFIADFELLPGGDGLLRLHLDDIELIQHEDELVLDAGFVFDVDVENPDDPFGTFTPADVEASGCIDRLNGGFFDLLIGDEGALVIDYAGALVLLPPVSVGGNPIVGDLDDLVDNASVFIEGTLILEDGEFILVADTVEVLAFNCSGGRGELPEPDFLPIPLGHLPPPGECRIWYINRPAGQQPPPVQCNSVGAAIPRNTWLIERRADDPGLVYLYVYDEVDRDLLLEIQVFDAMTGAFVGFEDF